MSWPRIFWDTFGNVMAQDIFGYFWQCHGLGYFGTRTVQGYRRRQFGEQLFSRSTPVDGSIKLVFSCNSPLVCSRFITFPSLFTFHVPLHSHLPTHYHFQLLFLLYFSLLCSINKRETKSIAQDCCKLPLTSSLLLPCHNKASRDELLQTSSKTKQKR